MSLVDISFRAVTTSHRLLTQARENFRDAQVTLAATIVTVSIRPYLIPFVIAELFQLRELCGMAKLRVREVIEMTNRRLVVKRRLVAQMLTRRGRFAILSYELVQTMVLLAFPDVVGN